MQQLQQLQNQAAAAVPVAPPSSTQAAVSSQTPSAMTGGVSSFVASGRAVAQAGVMQPSTVPAPVRTTLPVGGVVRGEASQPPKTVGPGLGQGVGVATAPQQQRPILPASSAQPATQSINTAGLNMLAAVGARQQQLQQQQRQQATSSPQPALVKVRVLVQFG